jgi:hypothetical protein
METCYGIAPVAILPHADIVAFMRRTPLVTVEPLAVTDIPRSRREIRDQGFDNSGADRQLTSP